MARSYRELPAHRMPHYEDDEINKRRTVRTTREVIVEKADDWNDPWMRKDNGKERKARGRERSYSSNSSYSSSSSSSRSRSSSDSSGSATKGNRRRSGAGGARFDAKKRSKEKISVPVHHKVDRARSSSLKRRHSPVSRSRIPTKKAPSPIPPPKRKKLGSPTQQRDMTKAGSQRKKRDSSSGSSSGSETGSSYSSSTSDSKGKKKREKNVSERKPSSKKGKTIQLLKSGLYFNFKYLQKVRKNIPRHLHQLKMMRN